MITSLQRLGDRMLRLMVPDTQAAATYCWRDEKYVSCGGWGLRYCWRQCCSDGWCGGWNCASGCV